MQVEFAPSLGIAPSRWELQTPASKEWTDLHFKHPSMKKKYESTSDPTHTALSRTLGRYSPPPPSPGTRLIQRCTFGECEPLLVLRQRKSNETPIKAHLLPAITAISLFPCSSHFNGMLHESNLVASCRCRLRLLDSVVVVTARRTAAHWEARVTSRGVRFVVLGASERWSRNERDPDSSRGMGETWRGRPHGDARRVGTEWWRRVGGGCDSLRRARVVGKRGTARREDPRDPWENGSRRADSPRSNASLDSFSQPVCAATSSSLPPIGPPSDPARPRARARRLSHPRALLCQRASPPIIPPPLSPLFRPLSPPRARTEKPPLVRHIYYVDTWAPEWKCSLRRGRFFFLLSLEKYLRPWPYVVELAFSSIIFFSLILRRARILIVTLDYLKDV